MIDVFHRIQLWLSTRQSRTDLDSEGHEELDDLDRVLRDTFAKEPIDAAEDQERNRLAIERVMFQTRRPEVRHPRPSLFKARFASGGSFAVLFLGGVAAATWGAAQTWGSDVDGEIAARAAATISGDARTLPSNLAVTQVPPIERARQAVENTTAADPATSASPSAVRQPSLASDHNKRATPVETARSLFERASDLRRRGDSAQALVLYERLQTRFPKARETHLSHAICGRLYLHSSTPERALRHFDSYLARGGTASQDALAGRADALRQLGRSAEEKEAWGRLLARYPKSVHAERARERLRALR